jgi:hypothetical protein
MRYLFGDSSGPFPLQYQFLDALERFVSNAAKAVVLDSEIQALQRANREVGAARGAALAQLEAAKDTSLRTLASHVTADTAEPTKEFVQKMSDYAAHLVDEIRESARALSEREVAQMNAEIGRRRAEIRSALEAFLLVMRIPHDQVAVTHRLRDGRNEMAASFYHPEAIETQFQLAASRVGGWQGPRKVGEVAQGIELPVGVKRSWLKRGVQHEMAILDDYVISAFELDEDSAEITLRRRVSDPDSLQFRIRREGEELAAEVHYPGDPEAEGVATTLDATAIGLLERLWKQLRASCDEVLMSRERLLQLSVDGEDVVEKDRVVPLVRAMVKLVAPTVVAIAKHSPNPDELSLKAENGDKTGGRREELYLRKAALWEKIEPLGSEERSLFEPLPIAPGAGS